MTATVLQDDDVTEISSNINTYLGSSVSQHGQMSYLNNQSSNALMESIQHIELTQSDI